MSFQIRNTLTEKELSEIETIYDHTMAHAGEDHASSLSLVLPEDGESSEDTFYLLARNAEGRVVSFLSVFLSDEETAEISGFTDPEYRRQGLFTELLDAAEEEACARFDDPVILYQCLTHDPDTRTYLEDNGLVLSCRECFMARTGGRTPDETKLPSVSLRKVTEAKDFAAMASLLGACYPEFSHAAEDYLLNVWDNPSSDSYLIRNSSGDVAGLVHLTHEENMTYLFGLGIHPDFRRKHLAEAAMRQILQELPEGCELRLQVSDRNTPAFSLYEKLGFHILSSLDYYEPE